MKKTLLILLSVLAVLSIGAALYAAEKHAKTNTPVLTPVTVGVAGFHCQACPDGLQKDLAKLPGATAVKATLNPAQVTATLDEAKLTASEFVAAVSAHPQAMDAHKTYTGKLVLYVDAEMCKANAKMCAGCFTEIPRVLKAVKGVKQVTLDATGKIASLTFTQGAKVTTKTLAAALAKSSYKFTVRFDQPVSAPASQSAGTGCPNCCQ